MRFSTLTTISSNFQLEIVFDTDENYTSVNVYQFNKLNKIVNSVTAFSKNSNNFSNVQEVLQNKLDISCVNQNDEERKEVKFINKLLTQTNFVGISQLKKFYKYIIK